MDRERQKAKEMVKNLPFGEKLKHYWGYYKRHIIIFAASAAVIAWSTVQCINAPVYDFNIACYTVRFYDDANTQKLADYMADYVDEINGNETKDVFISKYVSNIQKNILEPEDQAAFTKLTAELAADSYQTYILDKPFLDYFKKVYPEIIQNTVPLHEIPQMVEMLGISGGEELYLMTTTMFNQSLDDEEKIIEHKNAEKVNEQFVKLLEEAKK